MITVLQLHVSNFVTVHMERWSKITKKPTDLQKYKISGHHKEWS
jgi:hypothetical protein